MVNNNKSGNKLCVKTTKTVSDKPRFLHFNWSHRRRDWSCLTFKLNFLLWVCTWLVGQIFRLLHICMKVSFSWVHIFVTWTGGPTGPFNKLFWIVASSCDKKKSWGNTSGFYVAVAEAWKTFLFAFSFSSFFLFQPKRSRHIISTSL